MAKQSIPENDSRRYFFVSQVFMPDGSSTSQLFTALLERLSGEGFSFEVLTAFPASQKVESVETKGSLLIRRLGFRVIRTSSTVLKLLGYIFYSVSLFKHMVFQRDTRVIAVTNPPFLPVIVWLVSLVCPIRYQLIILDLYPEGLEAIGILNKKGVIAKTWRYLNKKAFDRAVGVAVLGRDMAKLVSAQYNINEGRIDWLPHWSPYDQLECDSINDSVLAFNPLAGKWVVQYSGNMGLWHDIEVLIRAAYLLRVNPAIHFQMIGDGLRKSAAMDLAKGLGLTNVTWAPFVPLKQLKQSLGACAVSFISQRSGLLGCAVPCKLYGILAVGRPIVAAVPVGSEVALVVDEERCGVVVPPHDHEALATVILDLYLNPEKTASMAENAADAYMSKYTLDQTVMRFKKILENRF